MRNVKHMEFDARHLNCSWDSHN